MKIGKFKLLIFSAVLILALWLRLINYTTLPKQGATFDEFAWTWLGINLIQKGEPISWSSHPQYKNKEHLIYQGAAFWIVKPYLEHPPLFGLVAGGFALLGGVKDMYDVTLAKIRPLSIALGVFSVLMVFVFAQELYGFWVGILSAIVYATVPTIVIGSRIVQNENFLIPVWLLSLWFIAKYLKTGKRWFRNIAAILAGLLSLAKVPWLVAGVSLVLILGFKRRIKDAALVALIVAGIFSLFLIYGIYFDKELFFNLWGLQLARFDMRFEGIFSIFIKPLLVDETFIDGWIFFGWLAIILLARDFKKHFFLLLPFFAYLLVYLLGIPDEPSHGWYRFPFYPFLLIAIAIILKEEFLKPSLVSPIFLFFVGLAGLSHTWQEIYGFSYVVYRLVIIFWSATLLPLFFPSRTTNLIAKVLFFLFLVFSVILNIITVINYYEV